MVAVVAAALAGSAFGGTAGTAFGPRMGGFHGVRAGRPARRPGSGGPDVRRRARRHRRCGPGFGQAPAGPADAGGRGGGLLASDVLKTAAAFLGISVGRRCRPTSKGGKTLAQEATAKGKKPAGLIAALDAGGEDEPRRGGGCRLDHAEAGRRGARARRADGHRARQQRASRPAREEGRPARRGGDLSRHVGRRHPDGARGRQDAGPARDGAREDGRRSSSRR